MIKNCPAVAGRFLILLTSKCGNGIMESMVSGFKKFLNFILDIFFPKKCLARLADGRGCGKNNIYICDDCLNKIELSKNNSCPFCDRPIPDTRICQKCRKIHHLDRLFWAVPYSNPLVKELIRIFKYHYIKELANPLAQLLIKCLTLCWKSDFQHKPAIIVPIPLHKRKLRERDFNQAELLAKNVAEYFSVPLENALTRKKYTPQQARTKNHKARRESLENAFEINPEFAKKCVAKNKNLLKEKIVILIDDVSTTGATLSEAAKVLKRAGAKEVWGLVIAKG